MCKNNNDLALKDGAVSPVKFLSDHSLLQEKRAVTALAAGKDNIILLNTCQQRKARIKKKRKGGKKKERKKKEASRKGRKVQERGWQGGRMGKGEREDSG